LTAVAIVASSARADEAGSIALTGTMGDKALLVVDGGAPVVIAPGETRDGVKLLRADGDTATVEAHGRRFSLATSRSTWAAPVMPAAATARASSSTPSPAGISSVPARSTA
jgi:hypothetical protein